MITSHPSLVRSHALVLAEPNIDTDQIIPARFLTTTSRKGLGQYAFADWRAAQDSPLSDPRAEGCTVLVAGNNFGCGSSREHAAWALADLGIRAVVSNQIADIFRANAIKNGIIPAVVDPQAHQLLLTHPWQSIEVDPVSCEVRAEGIVSSFNLDPFSQLCLTSGVDELGYLLQHDHAITAWETSPGERS